MPVIDIHGTTSGRSQPRTASSRYLLNEKRCIFQRRTPLTDRRTETTKIAPGIYGVLFIIGSAALAPLQILSPEISDGLFISSMSNFFSKVADNEASDIRCEHCVSLPLSKPETRDLPAGHSSACLFGFTDDWRW